MSSAAETVARVVDDGSGDGGDKRETTYTLMDMTFRGSNDDFGLQKEPLFEPPPSSAATDLRLSFEHQTSGGTARWLGMEMDDDGIDVDASVVEWLDDSALLISTEEGAVDEPTLLFQFKEDEEEKNAVAPVRRELKLSIDIPSDTPTATATVKKTKSKGERKRVPRGGRALQNDDDASPYQQLSPRSRRKRKNRDQMREARNKEKETMEKLRNTVDRLEATYVQVMQEKAALVADSPDAQRALRFPYMTTYTQSTSATLGSLTAGASSKYSELISATSRLKEENFRLKQTIHEKHKLQQTLERFQSDYVESSPASPRSLHNAIQDMHVDEFTEDYVPLTIEESWMVIRDTHERVRDVLQSIAKRAQERVLNQQQSNTKPSYFGWQIQYHTQDNVLLYKFEKPFYHVTALRSMEKMWEHELAMQSYRSAPDAANQTMKIVQRLSEDMYVFRRLMLDRSPEATAAVAAGSPPRYVKTSYIRFRLKTAQGYLLGLKSIDLDDDRDQMTKQDGGMVWASKLCVWTEFIQERTPYGHEVCVARLSGFTNLERGDINCRVAVDMVIQLLRWEITTIGPVITLSNE